MLKRYNLKSKGVAMPNKIDSTDFEQKFLECNDKFQTIFNLTSTASKVIRSDLTIVKVNEALTALLGYSAEEIEGTKIMEYACEEFKEHWLHLQHELWSKHVPFFKLEACLYRKDRSIVWVNVTTILYKDEGETFGFTVLDDITGLKNFKQSEARLSRALKYSKTAVWELDLKNNSIFRSSAHDEIFGYTQPQQNWELATYAAHIFEDDLPKFDEAMHLLVEGKNIDIQLRLINGDGPTRWINFQGTVEKDEKGKAVRVLGVIKDITFDKLIERHKDDFISIASHELKTPVTSLKAYLQILEKKKEALPEAIQNMIVKANLSVDKVVNLIDDLLNAGKSYQQQLKLKKTTFNLYNLAQECIEQVQHSSISPKILLTAPNDLRLTADIERIGRVIINLLTNAIKYAPYSKRIEIRIVEKGGKAQLSVSDQGPGIAPEKIPLLFDRYYQASPLEQSGLGLGLFISAEIIRRHGGEIWVESEPSSGTTFYFTVPL